MPCPCGSSKTYDDCCQVFHSGKSLPQTAEQLMRSRYAAFAKGEIAYLKDTTWPPYQKHFNEAAYSAMSNQNLWISLEIKEAISGGASDTKGTVRFVASSMLNGEIETHHENSLFKKKAGKWFYVKAIE